MKTDADVQRDIEDNAVLAATIRETGGECQCGEAGIFTVRLHDGRAFTRTALHGSGGVRRLAPQHRRHELARHELAHVLRDVARRWREDEPLVIYLVNDYCGAERLPVEIDKIAAIEFDDGTLRVTVEDCGRDFPRVMARGRHRGARYTIVQESTGAGLHWEIAAYDHLGRSLAPVTSGGRFYDGCDDHPEGALTWAERCVRVAIDKALHESGGEPR
jgi:hypothetical protein